jgi:plasmid stabilization system protein ParE
VGEAEVNFRVLWEEKALAELNEIWTRAIDREGVELASKRIDIELTYNPLAAGEARGSEHRVLFKFPVVVWFRVLERMREVHVLHVRPMKHL